jgi:hypothetical protein
MSAKQKTKVAIELPLTHKGSEEAYTKNPKLRPPLDNNHLMMCGKDVRKHTQMGVKQKHR